MRSLRMLLGCCLIGACTAGSGSIPASAVSPQRRDIPVETVPGDHITTTTIATTQHATATTHDRMHEHGRAGGGDQ